MPGTPTRERIQIPGRNTIDRADVAFESHGLRIGVRHGGLLAEADIAAFLPPEATATSPERLDRVYEVVHLDKDDSPVNRAGLHILVDGEHPEFPASHRTAERVVFGIEDQIERYVAEFSVDHLFVHAGVVVWHNQAIVIPGRSYAGKSTLTKGLVNAGGIYYSDEFAVFDRYGAVHPYRRKLSLRDGPYGAAGRIDMTGGTSESLPPVRVGLVALLSFKHDGGWKVETLSGAAAIMAICDHTVAIRRRPADTFAILGAVEREATVITGTRGEADDTIRRILIYIDG